MKTLTLFLSYDRYVNHYEADVFHNLDLWEKASGEQISLFAMIYHPFLIFLMLRRIVFELPKVHEILENGMMYD